MKQEKVQKTKMNPTGEDAKNLEAEFGKIKEAKIQPQTKTVKLYMHSIGGWVEREVPYNSKFADGDVINDHDRLPTDKRISYDGRCNRDVRYESWYRDHKANGVVPE